MPCYCNQCALIPKNTWCEAHRHKTEVEYVAKQSGKWIKLFLEGVKTRRGFDAYKVLREDVLNVWGKRNA